MRILLAEDDRQLNNTLTYQLETEGFTVDSCLDGEEALFYGEQNIYDIILLDRMLPHLEGTDVLTSLRKKGILTPIILITALGTLSDKVTGLDLGADDYLVKPFAFEELLARIRCVARRPHTLTGSDTLTVSDVTWQAQESILKGPSGSCTLSKREAALLETFLRSKGQTLPRQTLLLKVWGPDSDVEEGNLDNYIHFLRRRLQITGSSLQIKTIRGIGYIVHVQKSTHTAYSALCGNHGCHYDYYVPLLSLCFGNRTLQKSVPVFSKRYQYHYHQSGAAVRHLYGMAVQNGGAGKLSFLCAGRRHSFSI